MLVLKILLRGHLHGYAIAQSIQQLSDDLLRRARFYKLTPDGHKYPAEESARYRQGTGALARIMGCKPV
jgi:DNA-binding PadR family transcriptional regulator